MILLLRYSWNVRYLRVGACSQFTCESNESGHSDRFVSFFTDEIYCVFILSKFNNKLTDQPVLHKM